MAWDISSGPKHRKTRRLNGLNVQRLGANFFFCYARLMMPPTPQAPLETYRQALEELTQQGQLRRCKAITPTETHTTMGIEPKMVVRVDGQPAINFSSNDYLGLAQDERLKEAAIQAIRDYGTGSAASRLVSGTGPLVLALEQALAQFKHTEAALVFNSGYQANVGILQAILQPGDWVFCDRLNHASLIDGCQLSGARWTRYHHLDLQNLETRLQKAPTEARKWIVTDSVFSMDGDYPDLPALVAIAERHNALIMVDEAHATGLYGDARSSGLCEQLGVSDRITLQMGTFSKALGGAGAYVTGSQVMIDTLINRARGFIYSTALPPATIAAAHAAIQLVQTDLTPKNRLWENVAHFQQVACAAGMEQRLSLPLKSPIIPILVGDSAKTLHISQALLDAGYFVQGIRPPTVPAGTARLRIALSAAHTSEQIEGLIQALMLVLSE
jgi:8-amino-7-oxononanoate synthase